MTPPAARLHRQLQRETATRKCCRAVDIRIITRKTLQLRCEPGFCAIHECPDPVNAVTFRERYNFENVCSESAHVEERSLRLTRSPLSCSKAAIRIRRVGRTHPQKNRNQIRMQKTCRCRDNKCDSMLYLSLISKLRKTIRKHILQYFV